MIPCLMTKAVLLPCRNIGSETGALTFQRLKNGELERLQLRNEVELLFLRYIIIRLLA